MKICKKSWNHKTSTFDVVASVRFDQQAEPVKGHLRLDRPGYLG